MKKLVALLFVLCFISFVTFSKFESTFASTDNKTLDISNSIEVDFCDNVEETLDSQTIEVVETVNDSKAITLDNTDANSSIIEDYDLLKNDTPSVSDENNESVEIESEVEVVTSNYISKDEALNLLIDINPELTYEYQGDENTFSVLKDKGLSGYVFLPNIDTDLGYFVDKNTSHIYYFHPSGYLELIK